SHDLRPRLSQIDRSAPPPHGPTGPGAQRARSDPRRAQPPPASVPLTTERRPMPNSDTRVGAEYWQLSIHDWNELLARGSGAEGGPDEPPKFKVLRGHPDVPLTPAPPIDLGWADDSEGAEASDPPALPAADELTALLHYSFGFSRVVLGPADIWPYHRFVASARCFFPTEMYVCLREGADVPAGIHHYDPLHHRLVLLREGDWGGLVQQASRIRTDGAKYVLFLTSMFWKNAFRYRHYSY